ncbi:MAG: hydrolase [Gemmatimonadetes bacterium]|nr:hydrolase [Gemmatimonadota bacterium]
MRPPAFVPARWLPGPHAQTLGARLLRTRHGVVLRRERVELPDGDFVDLDWAEGVGPTVRRSGAPLVLVLHGLEGSARSGYALELYRQLGSVGLSAVGLNFRSCSGELNRAARLYHSGDTGDLAYVVEWLARRFPGRPLGAVGFSLGGNVLLKYLVESRAHDAPRPSSSLLASPRPGTGGRSDGIAVAAAVSVPFDLSAGADGLEQGFGRLYRRYLVTKLQRKVAGKAHVLAARIAVPQALAARTFREFDDVATAPLHGFRDAEDYYWRSSSGPLLAGIRVPTLLVHSLDDPFLPRSAVPDGAARSNAAITTVFTERGGHVGFVSGPPWSPVFWAERQVAAFLSHHLSTRTVDSDGARATAERSAPAGTRDPVDA